MKAHTQECFKIQNKIHPERTEPFECDCPPMRLSHIAVVDEADADPGARIALSRASTPTEKEDRELLAQEVEKRGNPITAKAIREGRYDQEWDVQIISALAAISRARSASVTPPGHRLLPEESTQEMVRAAYKAQPGAINAGFAQAYRDMVAASTPPAHGEGELREAAKIKYRGIFIERQGTDAGGYKFICHTGITKFLPDLYDTQDAAKIAVDAELAALSHAPSPPQEDGSGLVEADGNLCEDCPPVGYPTDKTRCTSCPRRALASTSKAGGREESFGVQPRSHRLSESTDPKKE